MRNSTWRLEAAGGSAGRRRAASRAAGAPGSQAIVSRTWSPSRCSSQIVRCSSEESENAS
jgi:hypothetical protein